MMTNPFSYDCFRAPPAGFGPVPFYWWAGEPLDRGRLAWQLDRLREKGLFQTVIGYPHLADGRTDPGDPPVFSPAWWELFRWFLDECRQRGMTAGFQDYTIISPLLQEIGRCTPDMQGGQLGCASCRVQGTGVVRLAAEQGTRIIGAWAYAVGTPPRGVREACGGRFGEPSLPEGTLDLSDRVRDGMLTAELPEGEWLVALVFARLSAFDPLHPDAGSLVIERLYAPFERECPGEVGRSLKVFFQDELDFGSRMPFWSNRLLQVFQDSKGYDVRPLLPALWHDLGPSTQKIRLDFADAVVRRLEACYFKPVFEWHEARGTLFGHDNCGRGEIAVGRHCYGDAFRTQRWFSAPGCDDPKLQGPRAFKGLKVNSSIAHLYRQPRVWCEAFHSSGWGTAPGEVVAALNEDFAYGATVVNLHGLYYTTAGGWWEWAAPDFHFRQPYWAHCGELNRYVTRLSWLLSQGSHRCDVAILYPIAGLDAQQEAPETRRLEAHVGNGVTQNEETDDPQPEESAFGLGKHLFDRACDFDFVDDESVARAGTAAGELRVSGEAYRVLVLPAMDAVRFATLEKARAFVQAGGIVIAYGRLPSASDCAGRGDAQVEALLEEVFGISEDPWRASVLKSRIDGRGNQSHVKRHPSGGRGVFICKGYGEVLRAINNSNLRDAVSTVEPLQVLHRRIGGCDVYYAFNPSPGPVETLLRLRAKGPAETWDAWTGKAALLPVDSVENGVSTVRVALAAKESKVVVFAGRVGNLEHRTLNIEHRAETSLRLEGPWTFTVRPTLDNRFGDFRLPASEGFLWPEARRFRYAEETGAGVNWHAADFDDAAWPETTYSFGPRFEVREQDAAWRPYAFSLRWGIERDPFLTDWLSGPHGLKSRVPDEFLDFYSETPGHVWELRSQVWAEAEGDVPFTMGGRCAYRAWLNGRLVLEQADALPPGRHQPWNIPHYECVPRETCVTLRKGVNHLRLELIQPEGQRTRAFVAFAPPARDEGFLGLRWFRDPRAPRPSCPAPQVRRAVWLRCLAPPGLRAVEFVARGPVRVWADGRELAVTGNRAESAEPFRGPVRIALRVEAPAEYRAGDVLAEPLRFDCGDGLMPTGDWCLHGLADYSGIGEYRKSFEWAKETRVGRVALDLGEVAATAEIRVNGKHAGTLLAPPWRVDVTGLVQPGNNDLTICVANTLANHYNVGIPTPYAFPHQLRSGLLGPVRLLTIPA